MAVFHFKNQKDLFILKDAFRHVVQVSINNSKRRNKYLDLLSGVIEYQRKEGVFLRLKDIPENVLNALKLSKDQLQSSLQVIETKWSDEADLRDGLIFQIAKDGLEKNWINEWYRYQEYDIDTSMRYASKHVFFELLLTLPYSLKDIYQATLFLFEKRDRYNYNYLVSKIKRIKEGAETIEEAIKPKRGKVNNLKFNQDLVDKAENEFLIEFSTHDEILEKVNRTAKMLGYKEISLSVLKKHFSKTEIQNKLRPGRNGDGWYQDNIEAPIHHEKLKYRDELHEGDGTRIQIPYYNSENNEVDFLSVYVILDVASGMVVGYQTDQFENHEMVIHAFDRMLKIHGYLPKSMTTDRASHYKAKRFKHFKSITKSLGTIWRFTSNPKGKAYVESFFRYFGQKISKSSPGYIGLGITCTSVDSRSERKRIRERIKNKKKLLTKEQLIHHVDELIEKYNNTVKPNQDSTPSQIYKSLKKKYSIPVSDLDKIRLTWKSKSNLVLNSEIGIKIDKKNTVHFQLNEANSLKYTNERKNKLTMYFQDDLRYLFLFDSRGNFVEKVKAFKKVKPSRGTASKRDDSVLTEHLNERSRRRSNLKKSNVERRQAVKEREAKIIPIEIAATVDNDKSSEYFMNKQYTRKHLSQEANPKVSVRRNGSMNLDIDKTRLYKPLDDVQNL